jgi:hypothetical protein
MRTVMTKLWLVLALTFGLVGQNPPNSSPTKTAAPLAHQLLGTWRLISIGSIRPDGTLEPVPELGLGRSAT